MTALHTDRRALLASAGTLLAGGFASAEFGASAANDSAGSRWPMSKYDAGGTGYAPDHVGPKSSVRVRWKREIYGHVFGPPTPIVFDGTVYYSAADTFLVVDAKSGTIRHELENAQYNSAPAIATDTAYRGEMPILADTKGVVAVNPTGGVDVFGHRHVWSNRWQYPNSDRNQNLITFGSETTNPPVIADGRLFYGGTGEGENAVVSLNPSSGKERWRVKVAGEPTRPAVRNGLVYVGNWGGRVRAMATEDGTERWRAKTSEKRVNSPAVTEERLFVTDRRNAYAFDAKSGDRLWRRQVNQQIWSSPSISDGTVFVASESKDGKLYALDAKTGETRWTFGEGGRKSSPVVADGVVYYPSNYDLHALDAKRGNRLWHRRLEGQVSTPAVVEGTVYAAGGHVLYALEEKR